MTCLPLAARGSAAARRAAARRRARRRAGEVPFGVYVHVPFCQTRCGYCDFNTYTATELGPGVSRGAYADTVLQELRLAADGAASDATGLPPVSSVFFGGGTPTPAARRAPGPDHPRDRRALRPRRRRRDHHRGEPGDGDAVLPGEAARRRASRASRWACSRPCRACSPCSTAQHRPGRPEQAVAEARAAGFEHVNLDLIYGSPYETDDDWRASLDAAIGAGPDHISAYALVVEEGTALARQVARGVVPRTGRRRARRPVRHRRRDAAREPASTGTRSRTGPARRGALPAQRPVLDRRQLVGLRARGAQPRRRRAVVERQAPGALHGAGRRRDAARPRAARRSTSQARSPSG